MSEAKVKENKIKTSKETLLKSFELMSTAKALTKLYEDNKAVCSKYVPSLYPDAKFDLISPVFSLSQIVSSIRLSYL